MESRIIKFKNEGRLSQNNAKPSDFSPRKTECASETSETSPKNPECTWGGGRPGRLGRARHLHLLAALRPGPRDQPPGLPRLVPLPVARRHGSIAPSSPRSENVNATRRTPHLARARSLNAAQIDEGNIYLCGCEGGKPRARGKSPGRRPEFFYRTGGERDLLGEGGDDDGEMCSGKFGNSVAERLKNFVSNCT